MSLGTLFLWLLLVAWEVNSWKITKYEVVDKSLFTGKDRKSFSLVIAIRKDATQSVWDVATEQEFEAELQKRLPRDECNLLENDSTETEIMLIVKCSQKISHSGAKLAHDSPPLKHTLDDYLLRKFGASNILVEHQRIYKKPISYWYGTPENLNVAMRLHFDEIASPERERLFKSYFVDRSLRDRLHAAEYEQQNAPWNLDRISMRFGPLQSDYLYLNEASDVDAYIVDTGVRVTHVEFGGRASFLINTVGDGSDTDLNGHGTHVAGIVGAQTYGVAKNVSLFAVKVLDANGDGTTSSIKLGMMAASERASQSGRRSVINLSFGGELSSILDQAVLALVQQNIVVSVAAGNENDNACNYSPGDLGGALGANDNYVMSVAASDISDARPSWSNYGSCVSLTAPGESITSTWYTSDTAVMELSGTSMSAPHVTGVAALVLQQNATLASAEVVTLIQEWNTPSIIVGTTVAGGGQNLLYSLIVDNASVSIATPTPSTPLPPPPIFIPPVEMGGAGCYAFPLVLLLCLCFFWNLS